MLNFGQLTWIKPNTAGCSVLTNLIINEYKDELKFRFKGKKWWQIWGKMEYPLCRAKSNRFSENLLQVWISWTSFTGETCFPNLIAIYFIEKCCVDFSWKFSWVKSTK